MTKKTTTMHMKVNYEGLTQHVRLMALSDDWAGAMKALQEGLAVPGGSEPADRAPDLAEETAIRILKGEAKLVSGTDGDGFVEDDTPDPKYLRDLAYVYRERFAVPQPHGGVLWIQPTARIDGWDRDPFLFPGEVHLRDVHWMQGAADGGIAAKLVKPVPPWLATAARTAAGPEFRAFVEEAEIRDSFRLKRNQREIARMDAGLPEGEEDEDDALLRSLRPVTASEEARWRAAVLAQAGPKSGRGWTTLRRGKKTWRVPKGAFEQWALRATHGAHLAAPWRVVSRPGAKLSGADDAYHTDWVLGAGVALDDYDPEDDLAKAADAARARLQKERLGFEAAVLSGNTVVQGTVVQPQSPDETVPPGSIVVLGGSGVEWGPLLETAAAFVVEVGGQSAHLAKNARADGDVPVLRVQDARRKFPPGSRVRIDCTRGLVELDAFRKDYVTERLNEVLGAGAVKRLTERGGRSAGATPRRGK